MTSPTRQPVAQGFNQRLIVVRMKKELQVGELDRLSQQCVESSHSQQLRQLRT